MFAGMGVPGCGDVALSAAHCGLLAVMGEARRNEAKRFINLIDALYDNRVKLIASAAAEPGALYTATDGTEAFEFQRTISRLTEMRSVEWLALPHGAPTRLAAAASRTGLSALAGSTGPEAAERGRIAPFSLAMSEPSVRVLEPRGALYL